MSMMPTLFGVVPAGAALDAAAGAGAAEAACPIIGTANARMRTGMKRANLLLMGLASTPCERFRRFRKNFPKWASKMRYCRLQPCKEGCFGIRDYSCRLEIASNQNICRIQPLTCPNLHPMRATEARMDHQSA